jgi:hypothetical protein
MLLLPSSEMGVRGCFWIEEWDPIDSDAEFLTKSEAEGLVCSEGLSIYSVQMRAIYISWNGQYPMEMVIDKCGTAR